MVRGHLRRKDRKMTALKFSGNNWVVDTNKVPNFDVVWTALQSRSRPNLLQVSQYGYIKLTFRISKPYTNARRHTGTRATFQAIIGFKGSIRILVQTSVDQVSSELFVDFNSIFIFRYSNSND